MSIFGTVFHVPTVREDDGIVFRRKADASAIAPQIADELKCEVTVEKYGKGWALKGTYEGIDCVWGLRGSLIARIN